MVKVLDDRPEAVPGAPLDRAGSVFLQERVHLDPARANADVGAALAAGDITREHADVCVRAAAKLPKRLHLVTVVDEATGEAVLGMTAVDRWLAGQAHVTAWSAGGGTALTNLVLLCPRHHQHVHAGIPDVKIHDGRAWVRLPAWMDRSRPWVRNLLHTAHHEADRIGQQLRLALDTHDPTRDGRRRHRIDPIDLRPWWEQTHQHRPTPRRPTLRSRLTVGGRRCAPLRGSGRR